MNIGLSNGCGRTIGFKNYKGKIMPQDNFLNQDKNPRDAQAWVNQGLLFRRQNNLQKAIECYNKALELNPNCDEAWHNKGIAIENLQKPHEAIACYTKALDINPKYYETWFNKGTVLYSLEKYEEAMECFNKVLELNPNNQSIVAEVWSYKGSILLKHYEKYQDAIECYDKAIHLNPVYTEAWIGKGFACANLGRISESITCFEKFLQVAPPSHPLREQTRAFIETLRRG
jgi:tetratricopeptide (TPR) repeat protein